MNYAALAALTFDLTTAPQTEPASLAERLRALLPELETDGDLPTLLTSKTLVQQVEEFVFRSQPSKSW